MKWNGTHLWRPLSYRLCFTKRIVASTCVKMLENSSWLDLGITVNFIVKPGCLLFKWKHFDNEFLIASNKIMNCSCLLTWLTATQKSLRRIRTLTWYMILLTVLRLSGSKCRVALFRSHAVVTARFSLNYWHVTSWAVSHHIDIR